MRPHDLELHLSDPGEAVAGRIGRLVRVGFEVRVDVETPAGVVLVTLTRTQALSLGLEVGLAAWVRAVPGAPTVPALGPPPAEEPVLVDA